MNSNNACQCHSTRFHFKLQSTLAQYPTLTNILISCSKSKSGRAKRSEGANYFHPSDVVITGLSSGGENNWIVEFYVLFPAVNDQVPQPTPPEEIVQMVRESQETIEKAVGVNINRVTAVRIPSKNKKNQ